MTPGYFFSPGEDGAEGVFRRLRAGKRAALFLDYDGTLVPIKKTPGLASLPEETREILQDLSTDQRFFVAIVTGRSLKNIRETVGIERGISYIGNHGFEAIVNGIHWIHPEAYRWRPLIFEALERLKNAVQGFQGVIVEDKGPTLALHYRQAPAVAFGALKKSVEELKEIAPFRIVKGKKIFEVRPGVDWDKGKAVLNTARDPMVLGSMIFYAGDDATDEDAFRALDADAVTITVGLKKKTAARYFLRNTSEVLHLLRLLKNI